MSCTRHPCRHCSPACASWPPEVCGTAAGESFGGADAVVVVLQRVNGRLVLGEAKTEASEEPAYPYRRSA